MKALLPLVGCFFISIFALFSAEHYYVPKKPEFESFWWHQDSITHEYLQIWITKDTAHDKLGYFAKDHLGSGNNCDVLLFFSSEDSLWQYMPGSFWDPTEVKDGSFLLGHQPTAIWFGDGLLIMNPCTYFKTNIVPAESAWADTTTIYTSKRQ